MSITTDPGASAHTTLVESTATARIEAPIQNVDIPSWCFSLTDAEYQACSPAHFAAAATKAPDGRRMSINVEVIGGSLMVQHYIEEIAEPDHLKLVSHSDLFTPSGRTKIDVTWELQATRIDDETCELSNTVHSAAPPEMLEFLARQGLAFDAFRNGRRPHSIFAQSIARHARRRR